MSKDKDQEAKQHREAFVKGVGNKDIPHIYTNGFSNALGTGDIATVFQSNGEASAVVNMSYTVAKTYAVTLMKLISEFESATGINIKTTHEIEECLHNVKK